MRKVVFDCMVFLQGAGSPTGPAAACLSKAEAGEVELRLSAEVLQEIRDVLTRPKTLANFPLLKPPDVERFLTRIAAFGRIVASVPKRASIPRDPKDEKYLDLAIECDAEYLVSRDHDLLSLMEESTTHGKMFRASYPKLLILDPVAFLTALGPT